MVVRKRHQDAERYAEQACRIALSCELPDYENPCLLEIGGGGSNEILLLNRSCFSLGTRMGAVINFSKVLKIKVRINLSS